MPTEYGSRVVKLILHFTFFLSGIGTVLIGQVLPVLAKRFSIGNLELSYFFPAQFAGSVTGTLWSSWFGKRHQYFAATALGAGLMGFGLILMNYPGYGVCLLGFVVNGLGIGLTLPSINMLVLEMNRRRSASALSVLNFCWGLGAILCKPFIDLLAGEASLEWVTYVLAIPLFASAVSLLPKCRRPAAEPTDEAPSPSTAIWTTRIAWTIALFNLIHVGFESGIGGWLTTYTTRVPGQALAPELSPIVLYFSFFVIGRGIAPVLFRFFSENAMLLLGLLLILSGMIVLITAGTVIGLSVGAVIAGSGTSWIFPTNVARFSHIFGPEASRRSTPLFISGTVGAALSTWLIGWISSQTGSLRVGMYVLLISAVILIALQIVLAARPKPASND